MELPEPPADLQESGREFWLSTHQHYELDARDQPALKAACRTLDEIDAVQRAVDADGVESVGASGQPVAHWGLGALRAHRLTLDRMLQRLALPDQHGRKPLSAESAHAKLAADGRWKDHRAARAAMGD